MRRQPRTIDFEVGQRIIVNDNCWLLPQLIGKTGTVAKSSWGEVVIDVDPIKMPSGRLLSRFTVHPDCLNTSSCRKD